MKASNYRRDISIVSLNKLRLSRHFADLAALCHQCSLTSAVKPALLVFEMPGILNVYDVGIDDIYVDPH